jgi:hypothetical protein
MKAANPATGTLQVLLLALLGLFFYVFLFGLIGLVGGMIISRVAHAQQLAATAAGMSMGSSAQAPSGYIATVLSNGKGMVVDATSDTATRCIPTCERTP